MTKDRDGGFEAAVKIAASARGLPSTNSVVDAYSESVRQLFFAEHPQYQNNTEQGLAAFLQSNSYKKIKPVWVHYPWSKLNVRTIPEEMFFRLRTARNRGMITPVEQKKFRNFHVAIAGLSVGSAILEALVMSGGPKRIRVADFDSVEVSNLNRMKAGLKDVGQNKCLVAKRRMLEIDPFLKITTFPDGINSGNLKSFLFTRPKVDLFIDEMDDIKLKLEARIFCRQHRIPVVMATDNGDAVIIDVERFDEEKNRKIFHGRVAENIALQSTGNRKKWLNLALKIIGRENLSGRMKKSIRELGKSLSAIPQLGTTAGQAGSLVAVLVREMSNKKAIPSGKYLFSLKQNLKKTH